jgi:hypothetical protein
LLKISAMTKEEIKTILDEHEKWLNYNDTGEMANLSGANLSGANLSGANLSGANLYGANLRGADLREADLREADLSGANLRGANLSGANLSVANLRGANLYGANLSVANLRGANLYGANLRGADLSRAKGLYIFGPMPTSNRICIAVWHENKWMVQAGCFWGDLKELEAAVKDKHNCPIYMANINLLKNWKYEG